MIKQVTLKNFRQHQSLTLTLTHGVTVLRGENEAGKSSVFEAIIYAMFGLRACRNSDIVTWGEDDKSLRVELVLQLPEGECTIYRTLRSAELRYGDRVVSGQGDVTAAVEQLLGLRPGVGSKIVFASQRDIRGVLEDGNVKTAQLIEELADLGAMDRLIERLQEREMTGSPAALEAALTAAQADLAGLGEREPPDLTEAEQALATLREAHPELLKKQAEIAQNLSKTSELWRLEQEQDVLRADLSARIHRISGELDQLAGQEQELRAVPAPDLDRLEQVTQQLAQAAQINALAAVCEQVRNLPVPKDRVPLSREQVEAEVRTLGDQQEVLLAELRQLKEDSAHLTALIEGSRVCSACGQTLPENEVTRKLREEAPGKLQAVKARQEFVQITRAEGTDRLTRLQAALRLSDNSDLAYRYPEHIDVDNMVTPAALTWRGKPVQPVETRALQAERDSLLRTEAHYAAAQKKLTALPEQRGSLTVSLTDCKTRLDQLQASRTAELQAQLTQLRQDAAALREQELANTARQTTLQAEIRAMLAEYAHWQTQRSKAHDKVREGEEQLRQLRFNNTLLRRLRQLKPEVSNKVWQTILHTVGHYFSAVRGFPAAVNKTQDGFTVSGKAIESLSGSTIDMLGLALRLTLLKTFSPSCPFLLLDEPFAACSEGRQSAAMSLLLGAGIGQVVIITHEDTSESVSGNLIEL